MNRVIALLCLHFAGVVLFFFLATRGGDTSVQAANGKKGGERAKILRLSIDTEPKSLDPITITDTISDGVARKIHNTLVRFELNHKTGALDVVPDLAERFDVSPDGTRYTFVLRRGVKFHNGREVKAQDVIYSLTRLLSAESKRPDWIKPMVKGSEEFYTAGGAKSADDHPPGMQATNDQTVVLELNEPFAPFIQHLCTVNCAIVPREAVENKSKPFARNPVGVGAFILTDWRQNQELVLSRNDNYYRGRPKLDAVKFFIVKEPAIRMEKFFGGELDAASDLPSGRLKEAMAKAGDENVVSYSTMRTNYIGIGMPNGEFKDKAELKPFGTDKRLRQAINYAIDRDYLCNVVLEGRGIPAKGILPPGMPGFKEGRPGWPKDIVKAKALLAAAGYPEGAGLPTLTILLRNDENTRKIAQTIAADLKIIGIQTELVAREWNSFLEMTDNAPRPMFLLGWVADYPDPDNFLYVLFHSNQWGPKGNITWFSNPKVDELTTKARNIVKMEDRIPLYQQAEDIILEESPWICTYHVRNVVLLRKQVTGIRGYVTPLDTGSEFPQVDFAFVDIEE